MRFDQSIPIDRFQGAEVQFLQVGSIQLQIHLDSDRKILLDYQGCVEDQGTWICNLQLCGEESLMSLIGQTIAVEFYSADTGIIRFSGGGAIDLVRDAPEVDLVRFLIGDDEFWA